MAGYIQDSFRGGISDYADKGQPGSFKMASNADIRKSVDSLSCQQALVDETGVSFTALIDWFIPCSDGNTYGFSRDGKVYKRISAATWSLVYTDANGQIKGASQAFTNDGKKWLVWATNDKLSRKEIPGLSNWSDVNADAGWPKSLTAASSHAMMFSSNNGNTYICNAQYIALFAYDGSVTAAALNLLPDTLARSLTERDDYMVIGTTRNDGRQESALFMWDELSSNYNVKKRVPIPSINAIIDGEMPIMQVGSNGQLVYGDSNNVLPLTKFPGGGQVNPGAVEYDNGLLLFGVYGGTSGYNGIYSYLRKDLLHPVALNLEYALEVDEIGAIKKSGSDLLVSYKSGTSYGVKKIDTTTKAVCDYYSLDLKAPIVINKMKMQVLAKWGKLIVNTAPLPTGTKIEAFYRLNKNGSFTQAKLLDGTDNFSTVGGQEAVFLIGEKAKIFEYHLKLTPSANTTPEVYQVLPLFDND
jgi:hypothetical protein